MMIMMDMLITMMMHHLKDDIAMILVRGESSALFLTISLIRLTRCDIICVSKTLLTGAYEGITEYFHFKSP